MSTENTIRKTDHWANIGRQGERKLVLDNSGAWSAVKGFGMEASETTAKVDVVW